MSDYRRRLLEAFDEALEAEASVSTERFEEGREVGRAQGAKEERERVVRWLRAAPAFAWTSDLADDIETGKHLP